MSEELKPCMMCDSSKTNDDLTAENDFYSKVLKINKEYRIMYSSGFGKPPRIEFEIWLGNRWVTILIYYLKYCVNCGRKIVEYGDIEAWNRRFDDD
mgnify:CR=1 FL=1